MPLSKPTNGSNADYANRIGLLFDAFNNGNYAFPATQVPSADANTLDDYEEGTWTMAIGFGGASTGQTTSANIGRYTKVGNKVALGGQITLTAKGSATGNATLSGLPFTVINASGGQCALPLRIYNATFADAPFLSTSIGTTTASFTETTNAGATTALTQADFTDTSSVTVGGHYFTS